MLGNYRNKSVLVLLVVLVFAFTGCGQDVSNAERKQKAQQLINGKELRAAVIELKKVLQNDAADNEARIALAEIYVATGQGASAEKEIRRVNQQGQKGERTVTLLAEALVMQRKFQRFIETVVIDDAFSREAKEQLRLLRARVNIALGKIDQAEEEYTAILSENPNTVRALAGLARIDFSRDLFDEGLANLERAIGIDANFADAWRLKGVAHYRQGNYSESVQAFRTAVALYQENLRAQDEYISRVGLIQTLLILKKSDQLAAEIDGLRRISSNHPLTLYFSALNNFLGKNYAAAENELSALIGRNPDHLPSQFLLGSVHYAEGNYEQANNYLTRFVKSVPTHFQARKILGATRLKLDRPEDALEVLTPIADSNVDDAQILAMVGQAASQSDQVDLAMDFYKRASKALPENYQLREELAKTYLQKGEFDNAIATLQNATGDNELNAKLLTTYAHLKKREIEKAKQILDEVAAKYPESVRVGLVKATVELLEGKRAEARVRLSKLEQEHRKSIPTLFAIARIDLENGKLKQARERFSRILELDRKNSQAMISLAQLEEQAGNSEQSILWLEQARTDDSVARLPRLILSRYYLKADQLQKSLAAAEELLAIDAKNEVSLAQHGTVLLAMNKPEKAVEAYEKIVEYHPTDMRGYLALSKIYTRLGQKDRASGVLSKMEAATENRLVAGLARIELELQTNNPDEAIKMATKLVAEYPTNFAAHMLLANGKAAKGDLDGAVESLGNSIKHTDRKEPVIQLTRLHLRQNRKRYAVAVLEKWLNSKDDPDVRFLLASVYQSMGKSADAESQYKRLLKLDQTNPLVLNNLTFIYLENDIGKALATAELAMDRAGNRPEILDTYGWVLVKSGQTEKGIRQLRSALSLTDHPEIRYHLAFALEMIAENDEALTHIDRLQRNAELSSELKEKVAQLSKKLSGN